MYELNNTMALGIDTEAIRKYDREHGIGEESLSSENKETKGETTTTSSKEDSLPKTTSETSETPHTTESKSGESSGQSLDDLVAYYDQLDVEIKALGSEEVIRNWLDKLEKNALDQLKFVLNMRNLMNLQKEYDKKPLSVIMKDIDKI